MEKAADNASPTYEDYLRALLVAGSNMVFRVSADWRVMRNFSSRELRSDTDSPGGPWLQKYVHPDDQAQVLVAINNAINTNCLFETEHRTLCEDGTSEWKITRAVPILNSDGHVVEWIGTSIDMTSRKQLEQQTAKDTKELKTRSHDLARLAQELTLIQYRERRRLADQLHDNLQQLLVAAKMKAKSTFTGDDLRQGEQLGELTEILNEAIDTTRTLTRDLAPPLALTGNLSDAFKWLVHDVKQRYDVTLKVRLAGKVDEVPEAECVLLYTAARELLTNVVKHSGSLQADLELLRKDEVIVLTIRDTGRGFDARFGRDIQQGFGLMSIRERVHLVGGRFTMNSDPGRGVETVIEIPMLFRRPVSSSSNAPLTPDQAAQNGGHGQESYKPISLLLVDDHQIVREALRTYLCVEDSVTVLGECCDGRQAVDSVRQLRPEVVIMDINMPVMDGLDATRLIKERWPLIKVIGLSMYSDLEMGQKIRDAGADAFVTKSAPPEELIEAIHRCSGRGASHGLSGRISS